MTFDADGGASGNCEGRDAIKEDETGASKLEAALSALNLGAGVDEGLPISKKALCDDARRSVAWSQLMLAASVPADPCGELECAGGGVSDSRGERLLRAVCEEPKAKEVTD